MNNAARQICFVDMPFGQKTDPKSRIEIDFDEVYEKGIAPAIEKAGLVPIRGDQEETGGLIHKAMFARLLLAEYVIADMTTANPNVFYELGVRHTAKPYTTIPIFATLDAPPFDVNMVRAIPYELTDGKLTDEAAAELIEGISKRITAALKSPVVDDSPLFELFPEFRGIEMSHELTDVFRDRVKYASELRDKLTKARKMQPRKAAVDAIREIACSQGDASSLERGVLIDIYLSYRAVEAWDDMINLYEAMSGDVQKTAIARQQLALALNRRNQSGDRDRAIDVLTTLLDEQGDSAETLGILGRIYKDMYRDAKDENALMASGWLDQAIDAYTRGFEAEPADFYPGVNAITLLLQKGDEEAMAAADRLAPLVTFAAVRQGGEKANDYWTAATVIELACTNRDYAMAQRCLPRALTLAKEGWMFKTTADNLRLIAGLRADEDDIDRVSDIAKALEEQAAKMDTG
ncbi:MAG: TRAFs-binding domain-containing protein [Geminicoccaceae bacterium]